MIARFSAVLMLLFLIACQSNQKSYQPENLRKLSQEEILERARQKINFSPYAVFKDSLGNPLSEEYREKLDRGKLAYDYYANDKNEVVELIVRTPTYEDDLLDIQKRIALNGSRSWEMVEPKEVDCQVKKRILTMVYKREKEIQKIRDSIGTESFMNALRNINFTRRFNTIQLLENDTTRAALDNLTSSFQYINLPNEVNQAANSEEKQINLIYQMHKKNKELVVGLLEKCGIPGRREVGNKGMEGLFYTIQHGEPYLRAQYYWLIKKSVARGDLKKRHQAILEDRMMRDYGKQQLYGSQIVKDKDTGVWRLYSVRDPEGLDIRRKKMGMEPIEEYLKRLKVEYDLEGLVD